MGTGAQDCGQRRDLGSQGPLTSRPLTPALVDSLSRVVFAARMGSGLLNFLF